MKNTLTTTAMIACGVLSAALSTASLAGAVHDTGLFTNTLAANDDGSTSQVDLGFQALIDATTYAQAYVNNNGNITFDSPLGIFTPAAISSGGFGPIIAPFFADVDTRGSGSSVVSYGTNTLGGLNVFGVNYVHVGAYSGLPFYNDFQVILTDRSDIGIGNFDIQFNYDTIVWESGQFSGGNSSGLGGTSALAGYWVSDTSNATLSGSLVNGAFINGGPNALISHSLNSNVLGQYNFQVRNGAVVTNDVPEPGSLALMGVALLVGLGSTLSKKRAS